MFGPITAAGRTMVQLNAGPRGIGDQAVRFQLGLRVYRARSQGALLVDHA